MVITMVKLSMKLESHLIFFPARQSVFSKCMLFRKSLPWLISVNFQVLLEFNFFMITLKNNISGLHTTGKRSKLQELGRKSILILFLRIYCQTFLFGKKKSELHHVTAETPTKVSTFT